MSTYSVQEPRDALRYGMTDRELADEPPTYPSNGHRWTESLGADGECRRWQRTCAACGDRVTAFRSTAIYQFGNDVERLPHAVPLESWESYAGCRAAPITGVAEEQATYEAARHPGRGLKPIRSEQAVSQLIARLKESRHATYEQLADDVGVDVRQIHRWRNGVQPAGFAALRLARLALLSHDPLTIRPLLRRQQT